MKDKFKPAIDFVREALKPMRLVQDSPHTAECREHGVAGHNVGTVNG